MGSILVVDDHPIVAAACRLVLGDLANDIVAARDVESGYEAFLTHKPGVVILDLSFPGEALGGIDLAQRISSNAPHAKILVFSMHADLNFVVPAMKAGATGYVLKDSSPDELPKAVRHIRLGHRYIDDRIDLRGTTSPLEIESGQPPALTRREKQALGLLGEGRSYPAIAEELGIKPSAVVRLIRQAKLKLGIRRTSDLLRRASSLAHKDETSGSIN